MSKKGGLRGNPPNNEFMSWTLDIHCFPTFHKKKTGKASKKLKKRVDFSNF